MSKTVSSWQKNYIFHILGISLKAIINDLINNIKSAIGHIIDILQLYLFPSAIMAQNTTTPKIYNIIIAYIVINFIKIVLLRLRLNN